MPSCCISSYFERYTPLSTWEKGVLSTMLIATIAAVVGGILYSQGSLPQGVLFGGIGLDLVLLAILKASRDRKILINEKESIVTTAQTTIAKVDEVVSPAEAGMKAAIKEKEFLATTAQTMIVKVDAVVRPDEAGMKAAIEASSFNEHVATRPVQRKEISLIDWVAPHLFLGTEHGVFAITNIPRFRGALPHEIPASQITVISLISRYIMRGSPHNPQRDDLFPPKPELHTHLVIDMDDDVDGSGWKILATQLDKIYETIEEARSAHRPVFVHCQYGVSRSATAILYYLMRKYGVTLEKAFGYLQTQRDCVLPNRCFRYHLLRFEQSGKLDFQPDWETREKALHGKHPLFNPKLSQTREWASKGSA